jgi:hypothetical protein
MTRVMSRSAKEGEGEATPFDEVIRRQVQAADRLEKAIEAVDFQAVGMQLRESLISLVGAARRRVELNEDDERPKDADVVGWNRVFMGKLCPGEKNDKLRSYMQALVEKAWSLVNWITHHRNANETAVLIALDGVDAIVRNYVRLFIRERADRNGPMPAVLIAQRADVLRHRHRTRRRLFRDLWRMRLGQSSRLSRRRRRSGR